MMGFDAWRGATDASGFSAIPGGYGENIWNYPNNAAHFWSATEDYTNGGTFNWSITASGSFFDGSVGSKSNLFSVRCIEDSDE